MTFIHREDGDTLHLYAEPQVLLKTDVQSRLDRVSKVLASTDRGDLLLVLRELGVIQARDDLSALVATLQAQKDELEKQLALWSAPTARLTFTQVNP